MKVALFSDIHGNITGLQAVLARLAELGEMDMIIAAGDILGGGPGADDLMDLLLDRQVYLLRGNQEEMAVDIKAVIHRVPERWRQYMYDTDEWLRANLSQAHRSLLSTLPLQHTVEMGDKRNLLVCHATPQSCWENVCSPNTPITALTAAYGNLDAEVVVYGHYHGHHVLRLANTTLVNVSSVGLRHDGLSAFTVVEYTQDRWIIQQYQVAYNTKEEARLMIKREVPTS